MKNKLWLLGAAALLPFAGIIGSISAVIAPVLNGLVPLFQGICSFFVWYLKELYAGFVVVLNNLSVLFLIMTLVVGSAVYTIRRERSDCAIEVNRQRAYDKWLYTHKPNTTPPSIFFGFEDMSKDNMSKNDPNVDTWHKHIQKPAKHEHITKSHKEARRAVKKAPATPTLVFPGDKPGQASMGLFGP